MSDPAHAKPTGPVEYPESDGEPMAETDLHRDEMVALIEGLKGRYESRPDVYVAGNLFVYYEEGVPSAVFAPASAIGPSPQRTTAASRAKRWGSGSRSKGSRFARSTRQPESRCFAQRSSAVAPTPKRSAPNVTLRGFVSWGSIPTRSERHALEVTGR